MKCLDYRRELLPGTGETEAMREHRMDCVFCSDLYKETAEFEAQVRHGLQVPVDAELAQRLLASIPRAGSIAAQPRVSRRNFLAAAAVGAMAVGAGVIAWRGRNDPIALSCIDFVMKEEAKSIMMGALPRAEALAALASSLPLERIEQIGKVMHIGPCPFQGGTAYHVVLMVPQGKVTLLVMPESKLAGDGRAAQDGMVASVIALPHGSVGIIGTNADVVRSVAGALRA